MSSARLRCGNPVLLDFLEEWQSESRGTDRERVYRKAADSMRACPTTFSHPTEATCLIGIGPKIAERLTKRYIKYKEDRGETPPPLVPCLKPTTKPTKGEKRKSGDIDIEENDDDDAGVAGPSGGIIAGEDRETLFDDGEPQLGFWDRARPAKKKKATKSKSNTTAGDGEEDDEPEESVPKKPRKPRRQQSYVPKHRSGAYAILLALAEFPEGSRVSKDELVVRAQPYCDSSFTLAETAGKAYGYTAWAGVKKLREENLVTQKGRPALFSLTTWGWQTVEAMVGVETGGDGGKTKGTGANKLADRSAASAVEAGQALTAPGSMPSRPFDLDDDDEGVDALEPLPGQGINVAQLPPRARYRSASIQPQNDELPDVKTPFTPRYLKAGTFQVHLVLDNREVAAKTDRDYIQRSFETVDCVPITRAMELGDVMWVAKGKLYENGKETGEEVELSLDYVCERKRLDDLIGSIKDGRFHEQKFRLKKLIGNVTYIIELPHGKVSAQTAALTDAITTAIFSTQVVNGFFVKLSPKLDDTIRYLARYTRLLKELFESKDLYMYPDSLVQVRTYQDLKSHLKETQLQREYFLSYNTLAAMASKSRTNTLRDVYLKMLMCTRGVSAEKALEIQRHFKTPRDFLESYGKCRNLEEGRRMVMAAVDPGARTDRRKVKAALSAKVWEVWGQ
ncbi:hypothetical protein ABW19_dt0209991 [Dactylella cylindrospora]|nr:hypothetical protein ABW19_dt0209991 [Dactylella cylindrospora]